MDKLLWFIVGFVVGAIAIVLGAVIFVDKDG